MGLFGSTRVSWTWAMCQKKECTQFSTGGDPWNQVGQKMKLEGPRGPDTIVWTLWLDYYTACWAQNTKINTVGEVCMKKKTF